MGKIFRSRPHLVFFALAALQAGFVVPVTVLSLTVGRAASGWVPSLWHAHEMVFGFALVVMAGYFSGKYSLRGTIILVSSWVMARAALFPGGPVEVGSALVACLFPVLLFLHAGWPMLRTAKTFRNSVFALVLAGIAIVDIALLTVPSFDNDTYGRLLGQTGVLLIIMMIYSMGGRITAAATSGAHQALGKRITNAAQINLERAGLIMLVMAGVAVMVDGPNVWLSLFSIGFAGVTALRLWRWQFWKLRDPSVLLLHAGFSWLVAGFVLVAVQPALALAMGDISVGDALHAVTIGALGTFTLNVMARVVLQKARKAMVLPGTILVAIGAVNIAAVLRVTAYLTAQSDLLLMAAGAFWVIAWGLFLSFLAGEVITSRR